MCHDCTDFMAGQAVRIEQILNPRTALHHGVTNGMVGKIYHHNHVWRHYPDQQLPESIPPHLNVVFENGSVTNIIFIKRHVRVRILSDSELRRPTGKIKLD